MENTILNELPDCPVEYTLTEIGYSLKPVLDSMWAWGVAYKEKYADSVQ